MWIPKSNRNDLPLRPVPASHWPVHPVEATRIKCASSAEGIRHLLFCEVVHIAWIFKHVRLQRRLPGPPPLQRDHMVAHCVEQLPVPPGICITPTVKREPFAHYRRQKKPDCSCSADARLRTERRRPGKETPARFMGGCRRDIGRNECN